MTSPVRPHGGTLIDRLIPPAEIDSCRARAADPPGGFAAQRGFVVWLTGLSDPYEPPDAPDVLVRSDRERVEDGATRIVQALLDRGLIAPLGVGAVS